MLLIESAEGGAGVLRRLAGEGDAVSRAAREALTIMHVDPDTGAEADDACVRGCYRCLLTYGNQNDHELIDRRDAIPWLRALAGRKHRPTWPAVSWPMALLPPAASPMRASPMRALPRWASPT